MVELRLWSPMPSPVSSPLPQPLWPAKGRAQVWEPGDALVSTTLDPLGSPLFHSGAQACVTLTNRTGFLCHDRSSCISASGVCDGIRTCSHGEDEDEALCREYLLSSAPVPDAPSRVPWRLPLNSNYPSGQTSSTMPKITSPLLIWCPLPRTPASTRTHTYVPTPGNAFAVCVSMSREPALKLHGRVQVLPPPGSLP